MKYDLMQLNYKKKSHIKVQNTLHPYLFKFKTVSQFNIPPTETSINISFSLIPPIFLRRTLCQLFPKTVFCSKEIIWKQLFTKSKTSVVARKPLFRIFNFRNSGDESATVFYGSVYHATRSVGRT